MWRCSKKSGFILPTVLFIIGLIAFLAVAITIVQRNGLMTADSQRVGLKAVYLAEYGVQDAVAKLKTDATYRSNTNVNKSKAATYTTSVADVSGQYVVSCYNPEYSSSSDNGKRVISVSGQIKVAGIVVATRGIVVNITITTSAAKTSIGDFAVFSQGSVVLSGSAAITGNTGVASGSITLSGSTKITGSVAASSITCPAWCTITGTKVTGYTDSSFAAMAPGVSSSVDSLKRSTYSSYSLPTGVSYSSGTYKYSAAKSISAGTYYVPGKLTFDGVGVLTGSGDVVIYCTGNVQIGNSGGLSGKFLIISEGTINIDGAAYAKSAVMISGGAFTIAGSGQLTGGALCFGSSGINISGAGFTYDKTAYDAFSDIVSGINVDYVGWGDSTGSCSISVDSYEYI